MKSIACLLVVGTAPLLACAKSEVAPTGHGLGIGIAPLALVGIDYACYDLAIVGPGGPVVSLGDPATSYLDGDSDTICSWQYGNGRGGDIAYVAPCDADDGDGDSPAQATNTVTVWFDGLYADPDGDHDPDEDTDIGGWQNPCPNGCSLPTLCRENSDTEVVFNFTVMRNARQGFFDVAVNFDDIFCSAKLDCVDELLHDPSVEPSTRGQTVVLAFACTVGEGQETTLYMNDIRVECDGPPAATYHVNPALGPGQHGPIPAGSPVFFQTASYIGREQFADLDKCYWNNALGLDVEALGPGCTLYGRATAAETAFTNPPHTTPSNTSYPVVSFEVPITSATGELVCDDAPHPLNGGNGVATIYGPIDGEHFTHEMTCSDDPIPTTHSAQYEVYNPTIDNGMVYDGGAGPLTYNHDSSIAWFDGLWHAVWNANEVPLEGVDGQYNFWATSADFVVWTDAMKAFSDVAYSANPVPANDTTSRQWQPGLLVVGNELWSIWSEDGRDANARGIWFSSLPAADGRWTNHRLMFPAGSYTAASVPVDPLVVPDNARAFVLLDGAQWKFFPTQNPIRLASGRVLAPGILYPVQSPATTHDWCGVIGFNAGACRFVSQIKFATVLYTDNDGATWTMACDPQPGADGRTRCGTTQADKPWAVWEPTVVELPCATPGLCVGMYVRNLDPRPESMCDDLSGCGDPPSAMLLYAESSNGGATWTDLRPVSIETASSRMHVLQSDGRQVMAHNDHRLRPGQPSLFAGPRKQISLFWNLAADPASWIAGTNVSGEEVNTSYPQMFEHDGAMHVVYTQGARNMSIRTAKVSPLPAPDQPYLFPRMVAEDPRHQLVSVSAAAGAALRFRGHQTVETRWIDDDEILSAGFWVKPEAGPFRMLLLDSDSNRDADPGNPTGLIFSLTSTADGSGFTPSLLGFGSGPGLDWLAGQSSTPILAGITPNGVTRRLTIVPEIAGLKLDFVVAGIATPLTHTPSTLRTG